MAINKVEANGETLIDLTNDTATANDVIEGQTFHLRSGAIATGTYKPSTEIEARLEATVGHSSKNLLDIDGFDDTQYNVHGYSENGYFRLVGTYQSDGAHQFFRIYFKLPAGSYILSGAPDYNTTPIRIAMCTYTSSPSNYTTIGYDSGDNLSFTLNNDSNCFIAFRFQSGVIGVPIDLTLPVMIRSGSISDDTFEPYVTPTDEKKQDKPVVLWEATTKSEMTEQVTFPTTEIENIGYFIVFVEVRSEVPEISEVVTFIVYNGMFFGELNYYHNISTVLSFAIEEGIAGIEVGTTDTHEPKIIKIVGIPK